MSNSLFNQEILDFRFFPKNGLISIYYFYKILNFPFIFVTSQNKKNITNNMHSYYYTAESIINQYNTMPINKKKINLFKFLYDGVRWNTDSSDLPFLCVVYIEK